MHYVKPPLIKTSVAQIDFIFVPCNSCIGGFGPFLALTCSTEPLSPCLHFKLFVGCPSSG